MITYINSSEKINLISYLKSLWVYKNIIWVFAKRNIKGKIAQTKLGVFIILLQAILLTLVFGFFISRFITFKVTYPYILFAVTGMMSWYIFSYVATFSGTSIMQNNQIASKIYFPRIILPLSYGLSVFVDFAGWLLVLIVLLIYYNITPSINIFATLIFLVLDVISGLALGFWIALLSLRYRDVALFAPLFIGIGMFFTPVFYPVKALPEFLSYLLYFNPLAGVAEGFRWAIFNQNFDFHYIYGFSISVIIFILGLLYFVKKDGNMSDNL